MTEHVNRGAGHGATTQTSGVRAGLRSTGMMDGQSTHGIMPNEVCHSVSVYPNKPLVGLRDAGLLLAHAKLRKFLWG